MSELIRVPKGLYGVAVAETSIAKSGSDGSLTYRGYGIKDLFDHSSFEESAFLVLKGRLPSRSELGNFVSDLRKHAVVPSKVYELVKGLPNDSHPIDVLRTAVSALGAIERNFSSEEQRFSVIAKMPALVANCHRIVRGLEPIEPDSDLGQGANLLYMIGGKTPSKFESWAFERELILYMEHDLNVSAFAVRVVASALADIYAACTAGLAALKGPLHGGANEAAMQMLMKIGNEEKAEAYVRDLFASGQKIMGFGHRVYKTVDPRAQLSKQLLERLLEEKKASRALYDLCKAVETKVWELKKLPANLDFYAAPIFYTLGISIDIYTPIFAASRVVGWVAHYDEQLSGNKLFRPDAVYVGPRDLKYVSLSER